MSYSSFRLFRFSAVAIALILPLLLDSCSSSKNKLKGAPANLPVVPIQGSAATPPHSMSHSEYPFDAGGNYVSAWAAEGEKRAGRGEASSSDYEGWKASHLDVRSTSSASTAKKAPKSEPKRIPLSPPIKITSTAPKKTGSVTAKKTPTVASKSSTTAKKTASSPVKKTGTSRSYIVKKGDTLFGIARKSGTSVAKIKAANGLKSDNIRDGQSLKIPQ